MEQVLIRALCAEAGRGALVSGQCSCPAVPTTCSLPTPFVLLAALASLLRPQAAPQQGTREAKARREEMGDPRAMEVGWKLA